MLLQTDQELRRYCDALRGAPAIFIDTEFVGEGRYYPEVGAIQVATPERAAVVDPLAVGDLAPLLTLLADPEVVKVFHAAGQDLPIFYRLIGAPVRSVFDTQVAAALLGYDEQISFVNLVERVTGTCLSKSHGFTDWLRRPLTPGQIEYALDDVRYLVPVHAKLVKELDARARMAWAREEFRKLEDERRFTPVDPHELYLRVRGVERIRGQALAILRELVAWREETAFAKNIPPSRVARDEVLVELARRPRESVKELHDIRGLAAQQVERFGAGLIEAIRHGAEAPRPTPQRSASLPSALEPTVDFLMLCLRSLAGEQSVAPGMVAVRSELVELALRGPKADIQLLRGWRRTAFGDPLLATLEGRATARIIPTTRQVHLDWKVSI
jgi:ribonuclease D